LTATRLRIGKVLLGAFVVPWWNRRAFMRALPVPLVSLAALSLGWRHFGDRLPALSNWLLYLVYLVFFTLLAVTVHRLVLLDSHAAAARILPSWSMRELRFLLFMAALWLVSTLAGAASLTLITNLWDGPLPQSGEGLFEWLTAAARIPILYLFARLCLVFPATAVDRKVGLRWSWAATRNNGWRLVVVVSILPWIITQVVHLLYRSNASAIEVVLLTVLSFVLLAIEVAALSLSYLELAGQSGYRPAPGVSP
jgi:hypothetical protein